MDENLTEYFDGKIQNLRSQREKLKHELEIIESKISLLESTKSDINELNKADFIKNTTVNSQTGVAICKSDCESYIRGKCKTNGMAKVSVGDDCLWGR